VAKCCTQVNLDPVQAKGERGGLRNLKIPGYFPKNRNHRIKIDKFKSESPNILKNPSRSDARLIC
jgi:hypothetical protein